MFRTILTIHFKYLSERMGVTVAYLVEYAVGTERTRGEDSSKILLVIFCKDRG